MSLKGVYLMPRQFDASVDQELKDHFARKISPVSEMISFVNQWFLRDFLANCNNNNDPCLNGGG